MAKIVVCGYMVRYPVAGMMLVYFHYLLGLHRLGHDILYLEESGWPKACYDPSSKTYGDDPTKGLRAVDDLLSRYGVEVEVGYVNRNTRQAFGLSWQEISQHLKDADLLINIGGVSWLPEFRDCSRLALIDLDPFFTQLGMFAKEGFDAYDILFSYGLNIGKPGCAIPTGGYSWCPTLPPVVPEIWRDDGGDPGVDRPFSTIANWSAYGGVEYEGRYYGQKREEFLRLGDLPTRSPIPLEVALAGIENHEEQALENDGWRLRESSFSENYDDYRAYIFGSRGEFSVAMEGYVATRSGWFSARSVCYLAAGRPAVLQDTGFSDCIDSGRGLLAFSSPEEAIAALEAVAADYEDHRCAARDLAREVFSYRRVLPALLERAMIGAAA